MSLQNVYSTTTEFLSALLLFKLIKVSWKDKPMKVLKVRTNKTMEQNWGGNVILNQRNI